MLFLDAAGCSRNCRENREQLGYILRHGSSVEIRAYAAALLIHSLADRK
jgi:hypothetical protein